MGILRRDSARRSYRSMASSCLASSTGLLQVSLVLSASPQTSRSLLLTCRRSPIAIRRTIIDLSIQCRLPETSGGSLRQHRQQRLRDRCLLSDASKVALIAPRPMTVGSTDDADGTDLVFGTCAHPDHSRPWAAFPEKCDLDA
jgi:hypothetical protein